MTLRQKLVAALAVVVLQAAIVLVALRVERARDAVEPAFAVERIAPRPAPDLAWTTADGSDGHLADVRGTVVVLHFWATWCPPCVNELPGLLELGHDDAVRVIAVSLDDDWAEVREFFAGRIPPGVVRASSSAVKQAYGVSVLPETWVIDADGLLRMRIAGERDWRGEEARSAIRGAVRSE
jgi:thiol-disulfide isomerase/thioredoxin